MTKHITQDKLHHLETVLEGALHYDTMMRTLYATDASVYRNLPLAVAYPKTETDIKQLIQFAQENNTSLIPRTAGTSLAGQCVGVGIVVDVSKHFNKIIEHNCSEGWVKVQPGVIRDELNEFLKPLGYFFGPNTSTANRCMIGGMVGNNSCGSTSIRYGATRDKVLSIDAILSDGSNCEFSALTSNELNDKFTSNSLESSIYKGLYDELNNKEQQQRIRKHFPKPEIQRRNTGYAIDVLLESDPFTADKKPFNICELLSGSEGTLAFSTAITLKIDPLPPQHSIMVAAHFHTINNSMKAVVSAMKHVLYTCELMDKTILDCTKGNIEQNKNRFFLQGDPQAILMLEVRHDDEKQVAKLADDLIASLVLDGYAYAYPKLYGNDIQKAMTLRSAGLGLLGNLPGDEKAVACIEDTAVTVADLPAYIEDFTAMMDKYGQSSVYYAHAGAGEIHLRPILNLKKKEGIELFRKISTECAHIVKKYGGSLSGEHGDGIVRAEFIPLMIGEENYDLIKRIKHLFDPNNIFNPGKIVNAPPMDESLRYEVDREEKEIQTVQDFSANGGVLLSAEKCNGSGDCRRLSFSGGTMCPSYRATRDEKDSTRGRANVLREFLTQSEKSNPFDHKEIKEVMDLCLSCKGCTSECPSGVDMAALKAEFLYQYQKENGVSFRTKMFAHSNKLNKIASNFTSLTNVVYKNKLLSGIIKKAMGVAPERDLPLLSKTTLHTWFEKEQPKFKGTKKGELYFFFDEFTDYLDAEIGQDAIVLLTQLGYEVKMIAHPESGRTYISKGMLLEAQNIANKNVDLFKDIISENIPLVGIEPSAILSFRDEYPRLVRSEIKTEASKLGENCILLEEFLKREIDSNNIQPSDFNDDEKTIKIHGHCHQKALSGVDFSYHALNLPKNFKVSVIPSGCCGMAGSFGYEKEHYELSMNIGELVLFPTVRKAKETTIIAAPGTSCRHQIFDGTKRKALHPATILRHSLKV